MPAGAFRIHVPLEAFEKSGDDHPMRIGGVVSTDALDKQGERLVQTGLDFAPFLAEGWFNDNHGQRTQDVLGYPTAAQFVRKGDRLPNGRSAASNGWWAEGYLLNTEEGRKVWGLCQAMAKSPRRLGFSIEGRVQARHPKDPTIVTRAMVKNVAVTHCPINTGTELNALVKALTAGGSVTNPGATPGEGFALRAESLDTKGDRDGEDDLELENLTAGPGDDANNGGVAGTNPHISKADEPPPLDVELIDTVREWAPAVGRSLLSAAPSKLTKSEARIIVRANHPKLSAAQVDALVARAALGG